MRKARFLEGLVGILFIIFSLPLQAMTTITVQTDQPGAKIAPTFVGLFIEDINFNGDGGLYAECVKNRSFEFPDAMMGWSVVKEEGADGTAIAFRREPYEPANANGLRIDVKKAGEGFGVSNEGFRGIGIQQGKKYYFSVFARTDNPAMSLRVEVVSPGGQTLLEGRLSNITGDWRNYSFLMEAQATEPKARLNLYITTEGTIDLDMISLFPEESALQMYGRPVPGLRKDLVELLAATQPGFLSD